MAFAECPLHMDGELDIYLANPRFTLREFWVFQNVKFSQNISKS